MNGAKRSGVVARLGGLIRWLRGLGGCVGPELDEPGRAEAQLRHFADRDPLTGLFNRRRFQEDLERRLVQARRQRTHGALFFLDLDQFKSINDTFGHWAGDEFLKSLAGLLQVRLREEDVIARLGGDEFAILLPRTDASQAQKVAEHILEQVRHHTVVLNGQAVSTTTSIGIAAFPDHGTTVKELLIYADRAMYQAKAMGRNTYCVYALDADGQAQIESRLTWEQRLGSAFKSDLLLLYCQPILDLRGNRVSRYELLLRMAGDGAEPIPVGAFLGNVEQEALMHGIDRWVVRRAIHLVAEHQQAGRELCVEVNLSPRALTDSELLPMIRHELAATAINPRQLVLEIGESDTMVNLNEAQRFVDSLKELGCRFALDDFGIGFSSFYNLKHLPADYLKIDGSFIRHLPQDPVAQHLVQAMAGVARGFGRRVIAEYVGDAETVQLLRGYGVDYAQGYYIGRPRALSEIFNGNGNGRPLAAASPMTATGTDITQAALGRSRVQEERGPVRGGLEPPKGYASWIEYAIRTMSTWDLYVQYLAAGRDLDRDSIRAAAEAEFESMVALKEAVEELLIAHTGAEPGGSGDQEDTPPCQCAHCHRLRAALGEMSGPASPDIYQGPPQYICPAQNPSRPIFC